MEGRRTKARESLTLALAQDDDPFRLSMAALLLAGVWMALDYPDDAPSATSHRTRARVCDARDGDAREATRPAAIDAD
jgi:hypothetical protein